MPNSLEKWEGSLEEVTQALLLKDESGLSRGSPILSRQVAQCDQSRGGRDMQRNEETRNGDDFLSH